MLMDDKGYIKLSDFGLSRNVEDGFCYEAGGTYIFFK